MSNNVHHVLFELQHPLNMLRDVLMSQIGNDIFNYERIVHSNSWWICYFLFFLVSFMELIIMERDNKATICFCCFYFCCLFLLFSFLAVAFFVVVVCFFGKGVGVFWCVLGGNFSGGFCVFYLFFIIYFFQYKCTIINIMVYLVYNKMLWDIGVLIIRKTTWRTTTLNLFKFMHELTSNCVSTLICSYNTPDSILINT